MRYRIALRMLGAMVAVVMLAGCAPSAPAEPPSITGSIRQINASGASGSMLVEGSGSADRAFVGVDPSTRILRDKDGTLVAASLRELDAGMWVEVWFTGPVAESYPVQAKAGTIVLRPDR